MFTPIYENRTLTSYENNSLVSSSKREVHLKLCRLSIKEMILSAPAICKRNWTMLCKPLQREISPLSFHPNLHGSK